jgi:hypothetical protein
MDWYQTWISERIPPARSGDQFMTSRRWRPWYHNGAASRAKRTPFAASKESFLALSVVLSLHHHPQPRRKGRCALIALGPSQALAEHRSTPHPTADTNKRSVQWHQDSAWQPNF